MSNMVSRLLNVSILIPLLTMFGCSSGGDGGVAAPLYSGATTPAAITQANADEVAQKSTEGVNEAVNLLSTGGGIPLIPLAVDISSNSAAEAQLLKDIALKVLQDSTGLDLPVGAVLTSDQLGYPFCGGSISVPDNFDQNSSLNFTMAFTNLCYDDGTTPPLLMNGVLTFSETDTSFSIAFTNFSVTIDGTAETFSGSFTCDLSLFQCTIATDFTGSDGNVYRLADVDIDGDSFFGYTIDATFYHYELGQVTIATTSPVNYGGCGIYPSSGVITVSSSDGSSITITFSGCSYSITGIDADSVSISVSGIWT